MNGSNITIGNIIKSIQDMNSRIDHLDNENKQLRDKISDLQKKIDEMSNNRSKCTLSELRRMCE